MMPGEENGVPVDFNTMTPEQKQAFLASLPELRGLNTKQKLLEDQMAQSAALRGRQSPQGYGLWGGVGMGLKDAAQEIAGGIEQRQTSGKLDENTMAIQRALGEALKGFNKPQSPGPWAGSYGMGE